MEISRSAFRVLNVLWDRGGLPAREIADILGKSCGWNKNTTYTILNRCVKGGLIERSEPDFCCRALVTREQVRSDKLGEMIEDVFEASPGLLFSTLINTNSLSEKDKAELRALIEGLE